MKLVIKNIRGESVSVELTPTETFKDVIEKVEKKIGVSLDLNDLALNGSKITESQPVLEYLGAYVSSMDVPEKNYFCAVPGCKNTKIKNINKVFFEFPTEEIRCHQWVLYCQRQAIGTGKKRIHLTPESSVCSDHFRPDQFVKNTNTLLKRTAVPCVKFFKQESRELPDKYSEGHGSPETFDNYNPQPTEQVSNEYKTNQVRLCRLCASTSEDFYLIFDEAGREMKIAEKINLSLPMKVDITDAYPKQICKSCYQDLNDFFDFVDQCSISQHNLLNSSHYKNFKHSDLPLALESNVIDLCADDKNSLEISCPLCQEGKLHKLWICKDAGKLSNKPITIVDGECIQNLNKSDEIVYNEVRETFISSDQYWLDEYTRLINTNTSKFDSPSSNFLIFGVSQAKNPSSSHNSSDNKNPEHLSDENEYVNDSSLPIISSDTFLKFEEVDDIDFTKHFLSETSQAPASRQDETKTTSTSGGTSENMSFLFICRICAKEFVKSQDLLNHAYDHSFFGFYQCSVCVSFFFSKDEIESHLLHHCSEKSISVYCRFCCESLASPLETHLCNRGNLCEYKCPVCFKQFTTDSKLHCHMKFHEDARYCNVCNKFVSSEVEFQKHFPCMHTPFKSYTCEECGKFFKSEASMKYHQRVHQNNQDIKPYCCNRCGKCFIRKAMLLHHISSHSDSVSEATSIICKLCHEAFPNTDAAVGHAEKIHKSEYIKKNAYNFDMQTVKTVFVCEFCERCFVDNFSLYRHREQHPSETPYECKFCRRVFSSDEQAHAHRQTHAVESKPIEYRIEFTLPKTYLCEYCERSFLNPTKYSEHLSIHFGSEPYKCRQCSLKFQTLDEAIVHRLTHGEVPFETKELDSYRPYDCHYCNKTFAIEDALIKHIRMHTGEKPFICDQCGKGFSQSSGLYTHQKVHSTERPYSCTICPRTFKIKGDRDVHVRKHSGDRPYKCEFCGKAFMTQHVYSQHKKIHTGERPYKCDVCGIAFRRSHVLTVHKRIHTGEKPNICQICGKRYRQKGDMLKHCRVQHGIITNKHSQSPVIKC